MTDQPPCPIRRAIVAMVTVTMFAASVAHASDLTLTRTARSGVPSLIGQERSWDRSCQPLASQVTITQQPAHGSVSVVTGESVIPSTTPREGSTGACAGHSVTGNQVIYRSEPGF